MGKEERYYHISKIKNKTSILENGLRDDNKAIFVCTSLDQLPIIASTQVFTTDYSIFIIDSKGFEKKPMQDRVAEIGSGSQFIIRQNHIDAKYIKHIEDVKWNYWDLMEHTWRIKYKVMMLPVEEMLEQDVKRSKEWTDHYNKKHGKKLIPDKDSR